MDYAQTDISGLVIRILEIAATWWIQAACLLCIGLLVAATIGLLIHFIQKMLTYSVRAARKREKSATAEKPVPANS